MVPTLMVGFDVIPQSAEEIDLPPEQIGKILVFSVVLAVCWYGIISLCVALALTPEQQTASTMATADANAAVWGGAWAGKLISIVESFRKVEGFAEAMDVMFFCAMASRKMSRYLRS